MTAGEAVETGERETSLAPDADRPRERDPGEGAPDDGDRFPVAGTIVAALVVIATLAIAGVLLLAMSPGGGLDRDPVGAEAPPFTLETLRGGDIASTDLAGAPVLVTFWASWCGTCKDDVPTLERIADAWGPEGVQVVGIVTDDVRDAAASFAVDAQLSYPSGFDADGTVARAYGVTGTPETFLVDADGRIAAKWVGPLPAGELEHTLAAVIGAE